MLRLENAGATVDLIGWEIIGLPALLLSHVACLRFLIPSFKHSSIQAFILHAFDLLLEVTQGDLLYY